MSAIFGIYHFGGKPARADDIECLSNEMRARAPEPANIWCEGPVALGCRMLRTTPESVNEKLPFHDTESGIVLVADARVDNRRELISELRIRDQWPEQMILTAMGRPENSFSVIDCRLSHLKISRGIETDMSVKAYFGYVENPVII